MVAINHTHDPAARSWVAGANRPDGDFPIQNLPFAVFQRPDEQHHWRGGVAIGDQIVDMHALGDAALLEGAAAAALRACLSPSLNALFRLGPTAWRALRHGLFDLLKEGAPPAGRDAVAACLVPQEDAIFKVAVDVGDYTDFYTSLFHADNIGRAMGLELVTPNFRWMPLAYHGRASSIAVSGRQVRRPLGQAKPPGAVIPQLQACQRLDYEAELAIYIGQGNAAGERVPIDEAEDKVFGIGLLNDWSARDIQVWEQAPLGPFLAKNFATSVSPWIVTLEALAPFRAAVSRPDGDSPPLPYLDSDRNRTSGCFDIVLEVRLGTARQREAGRLPRRVSVTSFRHQYWTVAQMIAHHTVNGCNLQIGDVIGSGTVSGPGEGEAGALIELSKAGNAPVPLGAGEERAFLEDGDTVTLSGYCAKDGFARIGFGDCAGEVQPAPTL
jgi:fumarylacetoacetase